MKRLSKVLSKLFVLSAASIAISAISISGSSNNESSVNRMSASLNANERGAKADFLSTDDNNGFENTPTNNTNVNVVDLSKTGIVQNTAYDLNGTGVAMFTSSTSSNTGSGGATSTTIGTTTVDQITKFQTGNFFGIDNGSESITKHAGEIAWTVSKENLIQTIEGTTGNSIKQSAGTLDFKAMLYSTGGEFSPKSLFVIGEYKNGSTSNGANGTYLFQIIWEDQIIQGKKYNAGQFRKAIQLSNESGPKYNFLAMEVASTHTMQIVEINKFNVQTSYGTSSNNQVKFTTVSNASFNNTTSQQIPSSSTINLDGNLNQKFTNNQNYTPFCVTRVNTSLFVALKSESSSLDSKSIVLLKSNNLKDNNPTFDKAVNISLNELNNTTTPGIQQASTNKTIYPTILFNDNYTNPEFDLFFSVDGSTKYVYDKLNFVNWKLESSENNEPNTTNKSSVIQGVSGAGAIKQITKTYSLNSANATGYYGLTTDNKVLSLDKKFNPLSEPILFDFNKSTINFGDINFIYTKQGEVNWFALRNKGVFGEFSKNTLLGQWDILSKNESYELPIRFNIKSQNEIDPRILFRKVADIQNNSASYNAEFLKFLESSTAYANFIDVDINSLDPRLNGALPLITVRVDNLGNNNGATGPSNWNETIVQSKQFPVTLIFEQTLRTIKPSGEIDSTKSKKIEIARATYTFNNADATLEGYTDKNAEDFAMPGYVQNMYPSEIVEILKKSVSSESTIEDKNFINYFLKMENVSGASYSFSGNDTNGTLSITVGVPLIWLDGELISNHVETFHFGTSGDPFFKSNPFGKDAQGNFNDKITPIDDEFASKEENKERIEILKGKYSSKLPSSINKQDIVNDFLVYGNAFRNQQFINSSIFMPTDENITIIPNDKEGKVYAEVIFPQIGPKINYKVSFETPALFAKDPTASQMVYFAWKNSDDISLPGSAEPSGIQASQVANLINSAANQDDKSSLITLLNGFADFSSYFVSLIIEGNIIVSALYDDTYGALAIELVVSEGIEIPGITTNTISNTYFNFNTTQKASDSSNGTINIAQDFKFNTYNGKKDITPSSIKESDLIGNVLPSDWTTKWKNQYNASIMLTPSNATGSLQVRVVIPNYLDNGKLLSSKTFTTTVTGLKVAKQTSNIITWKTNDDFNKNDTPAQIKSLILSKVGGNPLDPDYNYKILSEVAYITKELDDKLKANPSAVQNITLLENNIDGTLAVNASINIDGKTELFSTIITGLRGTAYSYTTAFKIVGEGEGSADMALLRKMKPSQIKTDNENLLNIINLSATGNLVQNIELGSDDFKGTLTITLRVTDPITGDVLSEDSKTFTGFATESYLNEGTNWLIVIASVIVPAIVLSIPIVAFGLIQNKRDMKKIAKKLSHRLAEEQEKSKRSARLKKLVKDIK